MSLAIVLRVLHLGAAIALVGSCTFPQLDAALRLAIVTEGAAEAVMAYTLFRKNLSPTGRLPVPPVPSHLECLIDRQGYIRGRWLSDDWPGWAENHALLAAIEQLHQEKPRAPASDEHVHCGGDA
jgi:putative copper resistance protein D